MPGCATITEVITAMEAGADIVKIFPADLYGPKIIKDIKGPLPQAQMMLQAALTRITLLIGLRQALLQ